MNAPNQPSILEAVPAAGCSLTFDLKPTTDARAALTRLAGRAWPHVVWGFGLPLAQALGAKVPGLTAFASLTGPSVSFPSTQGAVWAFVEGDAVDEVHDRSLEVAQALGDDFTLAEEVPTFRYRGGRDLTGYEDGTENPKGEKARAAAIVSGQGEGLDGASFASVQRFVHDLGAFAALPPERRDHTIGRSLHTNDELANAPVTAHVKRAAQESFDPEAFMVRRSMPWGGVAQRGLLFVAYGESPGRFERVLRRMAGLEDGVADALLSFTRATSGGHYWCAPMVADRLDLRALLGRR